MDSKPNPRTDQSEPSTPLSRCSILIAEDEANIRFLMVETLKKHGYDVLEAANGRDAVAMACDPLQPIRLLITDLGLPGMNGREVMAQVASSRPDLKVLCLSAAVPDGTLGVSPQQFLAKPFTLKGLVKKVKQILGEPSDTDLRNRKVG